MDKARHELTIELDVRLDFATALAQVEALKQVLMEMAKGSSVHEDEPKECVVTTKGGIVREPVSIGGVMKHGRDDRSL